MLKPDAAVDAARNLLEHHRTERRQLDVLRRYWKGRQALPSVIPSAAPQEVRTMARIARVNFCEIVVSTLSQSMFVDGFRAGDDATDLDVWATWQRNRMDARQTGIHRAAFAYGTSYAVVLPGAPTPVIRGVSPRRMTALYGEDPDWPILALERVRGGPWRLYDETSVYYLAVNDDKVTFLESREHRLGVTPVVRYRDEDDLDLDDDVEPADRIVGAVTEDVPMTGQIFPLMRLQDQADLTTFGLLTAQWYSAFRQRWAIGWTAENEAAKMKAAASQLWTFDESPEDMKLGEFDQTSVDGYIKSREATIRHAATLSQTPVHELIGELVNLSAEALAAAEAGRDRKVDERQTIVGESHEQTFWLAGQASGIEIPADAEVRWRDTSARAFSATVDALGKLVTMLGIPPQELWERVPGATRQDVERWKAAAESGDSFRVLADMLERQAQDG